MSVGVLFALDSKSSFYNIRVNNSIEIGTVQLGNFLVDVDFIEHIIEGVAIKGAEILELQSQIPCIFMANKGLHVHVLIIC